MKSLKRLLLLSLFLSNTTFAGVLPIAARYDGVGGFYGIGYEQQVGSYRFLLGGVGGDLSAYGALITKNFSKNFELDSGLDFNFLMNPSFLMAPPSPL